ncbi:hypothetical protein [Sulfuriferula nivalis]|nr:hypothetical protein [Sulfuriferula nivalis]
MKDGIDALMILDGVEIWLAYRARGNRNKKYYPTDFVLRDKEIYKILEGKYQSSFLIYCLADEDDSKSTLEDVYIIDLALVGENLMHNEGWMRWLWTGSFKEEVKGGLPYMVNPVGVNGYGFPTARSNWSKEICFKAKMSGSRFTISIPNIIYPYFHSIGEYNRHIEEARAYAREQAKDLCDMLGLGTHDFMRQMYEL